MGPFLTVFSSTLLYLITGIQAGPCLTALLFNYHLSFSLYAITRDFNTYLFGLYLVYVSLSPHLIHHICTPTFSTAEPFITLSIYHSTIYAYCHFIIYFTHIRDFSISLLIMQPFIDILTWDFSLFTLGFYHST